MDKKMDMVTDIANMPIQTDFPIADILLSHATETMTLESLFAEQEITKRFNLMFAVMSASIEADIAALAKGMSCESEC